jgi:DNA-binding transcriptional MerR regulator
MMNGTGTSLRSGDLARLTGLSSDTIRHYERLRILSESPRTASGYRMYGREAVDRVRLVQRALQLGFTLPELSEILQARDRGGVPCHRVLTMAEEKLRFLDQQIQELRRTQRYMRQLIRQWRAKLTHAGAGSRAMLLQSLADKPALRARAGDTFKKRKRP